MLHVLDAPAITTTGRQPRAPLIFDALHDLIKEGKACFPDEVLEELKRLAKGEFAYSWAKAAAASRFDKGAAYRHYQTISNKVPDLIDDYAEYESSAPSVLAQAWSLIQVGHEVTVVTEDVRAKPTRLSLAEACARLSVPWCGVRDCLAACGHTDLWSG